MALSIVRHDITRIKADAIVNSTNEHFIVGGLGVDASIHYAAGPELKKALDEIGFCPIGSAVITGSYNIPTCKYIIHAVTPLYINGHYSEKELLQSCYRSILKLAVENGCKSIAIPLLSAGAYGYPRDEAYRIATSTIRDWIIRTDYLDLEISLVLYEKAAVEYGKSVDSDVYDYITDRYTESHKAALREYYGDSDRYRVNRRYGSRLESQIRPAEDRKQPDHVTVKAEDTSNYADVDLSFAEMCEWWCEKKGLKKSEFFIASNITKATFSNMKLHPDRSPKKNTVFACAIGLKLDIDQAKDLLMRAGMTFSKHYPTDRLVEQCILHRMYDVYEINYELDKMDLIGLGYNFKEK